VNFEPGHAPVYRVKLSVFERLTGYTSDAVHAKIKKGVWREGVHYVKAEDGNILMDLRAYDEWAGSQQQAA
jgi:hypothetical protein